MILPLGGPRVYRPQKRRGAQAAIQRSVPPHSRVETRPAPPVYRTQPGNHPSVQLRPVTGSRLETRPAPPVYRPQDPMQARVQLSPAGASRVSPPAARPVFVPAVQRVASSRPAPGGVVQRLVILVSQDSAAEKNYESLVNSDPSADATGSLRGGDETVGGKPLDQLGESELLHIVSHGDGQGHVEGQDDAGQPKQMNASEFLDFLITAGLNPAKHKGTIRFVSCLSGTKTKSGTTFAEQFTAALRKKNFQNAVIGFDGLVAIRQDTSIGVVPPSKIKEHDMLQNVQTTLGEMYQQTLASMKRKDLSREQFAARKQYAQDLLEVRKTRVAEMNALFEPAEPGKNIAYFPPAS